MKSNMSDQSTWLSRLNLPALAVAALFVIAGGPRLAAQNPNLGNTSGLGGTVQAILTATDSNGRDVSNGLTVVVGQPIPTVTFAASWPGVPAARSWAIRLNAISQNPYIIAPGLSILNSTLVTGNTGPIESDVNNAATAQLAGTPTQTGLFGIGITAFMLAGGLNANTGTGSQLFSYLILVDAAPPASFTTQPASQTVAVGESVTFMAAASGTPTYQWSGPNGVISGATSATLTLTNVQLSAAGFYTVTATVSGGSVTSDGATLTVLPLSAPSFTVNPVSVTITSGRSAAFSVAASGELPPTYQWNFNGAPISGATDPVLLVSAATSANAGAYTCAAANASGTVTSTSATLTVTTTSTPGYLVNLSARANVGTGNNLLIGGFGVSGAGTKQLLLRGVGPGLFNTFGLAGELVTPQLTLLDNNGALIASDIGWANSPTSGPSAGAESPQAAPASLMTTLGAFSYQAGSADTALAITAPPGNNTAQVSGVGSTGGIGLCEVYDADTDTPTAHLINISARANVGTANNILIGGFAIGGNTAETVLIRAVGPSLTDVFSLGGTLGQPVLTLLQSGTVLYTNTVWGGDATIAGVFPTVGAFNLNAAHQDSVLLVTLPPGDYTAQVSGLNSGTGIALCEIYEVY